MGRQDESRSRPPGIEGQKMKWTVSGKRRREAARGGRRRQKSAEGDGSQQEAAEVSKRRRESAEGGRIIFIRHENRYS